jgi:hypothetical protein
MKKTLLSLAIVTFLIGLIMTSCQTKSVPEDSANVGTGDSLKNLGDLIDHTLLKLDCTLVQIPQGPATSNAPTTSRAPHDDVVVVGTGDTAKLSISLLCESTTNLVEAYELLKNENARLKDELEKLSSGTKKKNNTKIMK